MNLNWMLEEYDGIVYVSDLETYELKYINRAGCQMFGFMQKEILSGHKTCYEVLQGRDSPCPFCTNHRIRESGFYEWEYYNPVLKKTLLLKDRKFVWEGRESRIEFAVDISEYRDMIKSRENERDSVLKCLPGGIARVDARDARTVLWYGANFLPMIGYSREQFEQELHSECTYVHPDDLDKITQIMSNLRETGKTVITEMKIVKRSGEVRTLTTTFSYEGGDSSEDGIPSCYSVGIDITEMKEQQEIQRRALEEAYYAAKIANAAKTDFLSSMSHDIRTPMNAILGMTAIAGANISDQAKVQDCLNKIGASSKHLLSLINEVLDMSKIESGRVDLSEENFDLAELIQNVMNLCRPLLAEKNHHIKVHIDHVTHEKIIGDMERLQQVFVNFLSNAIKYTPPKGNISFSISEKKLHVSQASLFVFVFEDDGIGMHPDFLKHIFEPFSRAEDSRINKIQGTGLGMAISENIIHMMNGSIQVDSKPGRGSRFTVNVPLKLQDIAEETAQDLTDLSVLVADDDRDVCENTCLLLREIGMNGRWVLSGREAVQEVIHAHKNKEDYFAVLLDWKMPKMSGLETARSIRAQVGPDIPIIVVSAYDYSDVEEDFVVAGVDAFITKPLFKSKMLHVFRRFVKGKNTGNENGRMEASPFDFSLKRLLLVEDNDLNREIAEELLLMTGASVDTAENGREAVEKFAKSACGYYDIILMDLQMPFMNGYEATAAIRALDREDAGTVPILALTANAFSEDVISARNAGMNEHIAKPIDAEKMYRIIQKWFHSSAAE